MKMISMAGLTDAELTKIQAEVDYVLSISLPYMSEEDIYKGWVESQMEKDYDKSIDTTDYDALESKYYDEMEEEE